MRCILRCLVAVIAIAAAPQAMAQSLADHARVSFFKKASSTNKYNLLESAALNASPTFTVSLGSPTSGDSGFSYSKLNVDVFYTYAAATTVTVKFECSGDGTNFGRKTSRSIVAGASTATALLDTWTTGAASFAQRFEYDVRGCQAAKITFGGAGAGATDLITAQANAVSGG